jgi:hypothetical protein
MITKDRKVTVPIQIGYKTYESHRIILRACNLVDSSRHSGGTVQLPCGSLTLACKEHSAEISPLQLQATARL